MHIAALELIARPHLQRRLSYTIGEGGVAILGRM